MMDDIWLKVAQFLGTLNREHVSRASYVRTPEYEKALQAWKEKEAEWETFLNTLSMEQKAKVENQTDCLEDLSSAQEGRAYIQGYVDCIQALYHMGLLKENEKLQLIDMESLI